MKQQLFSNYRQQSQQSNHRSCIGVLIPLAAAATLMAGSVMSLHITSIGSRHMFRRPNDIRRVRLFSHVHPEEGFCADSKTAAMSRKSCTGSENDALRQHRMQELRESSRLSLAPMMEYTDRHFRYLVRLISKRTLVYTEMVAANAIAHERNDAMQNYLSAHSGVDHDNLRSNYDDSLLRRYLSQTQIKPGEGPSILQLGGSSPEQLFASAQTVVDMELRGHCNYTAINLNCGCPSPKVAGKGCFGASLMDNPSLVTDLTNAIFEGCERRMPVTVKCRIGTDTETPYSALSYASIDPEQEYRRLCRFIETVASGGVVTDFQVHARIAVLSKTFSPADNRKVPPLKYELVRRLVQDFPELTFSLNGGVNTINEALNELDLCPGLAGVMVGRAWAAAPWNFAMADRLLFGVDESSQPLKNRLQILEAFGKHADFEESVYDPVRIRRFLVKAITPLFAGEPNAKRYRIALDEIAASAKELHSKGVSFKSQPPLSELIMTTALENLSEETLLRSPQESYERFIREATPAKDGSKTVSEWQQERKNLSDALCFRRFV